MVALTLGGVAALLVPAGCVVMGWTWVALAPVAGVGVVLAAFARGWQRLAALAVCIPLLAFGAAWSVLMLSASEHQGQAPSAHHGQGATDVHEYQTEYAAMPADDAELTGWLRAQPGVSDVTVSRNGRVLIVRFGVSGKRSDPSPDVTKQAGRLGYK